MLAAVVVLAWFLTGQLRRYAISRRLLDVPNARSSHQVATPRGGGGAIVLAATLGLAWWSWVSHAPDLAGVLVGGLFVAAVGFADDHRHVAPGIRLLVHAAAAMLAVTSLDVAGSVAGASLAVFFVVWFINLTNFMDGIDGLAGVEVLTVGGAAAVLSAAVSSGTGLWIEPAILAAAAAGFLIWNWPPARIFMGDVGSGYVGFMVAVLTLRAAAASPALGWSWLTLWGVFLVDATVTLLRRTARGDRLVEAHRSHAYQRLAVAWGGHRPVTLLVLGINACWLVPMAALVATNQVSGPAGLLVACLPLAVGAIHCGAGNALDS